MKNNTPPDAERASQKSANKSVRRFRWRAVGLYITALFCLVLIVAFLLERLSLLALYAYGIMSLLTFIVYAWDKTAAKRDVRRVPEKYLHLLALFCGWPGAVLAQRLIRHKSSKRRFQLIFWLSVVLNCCLLGFFLYSAAQQQVMAA